MEASALPASVGLARARLGLGAPLLRLRSDEQLVSLVRAGNEDAFRVVHDRYRARMLAYARQMLASSSADPEDVVQEIFVRAYAGLRADRRDLALRAWLYRIAHNRCIDELRRPQAIAVETIEDLGEAPGPDPHARVEQREALQRLISDIRRLPEQQQSALLMRELGGMPYAELSGALGVSVPAVKSLLVRARVGLAQAGEARDTACTVIREDLIVAHDRGVRASGRARRHLRDCSECRQFRGEVQSMSRRFGLLIPAVGPLAAIAKLIGFGGGLGFGGGGGAAAGSGTGAAAGSTVAGTTAAGAGSTAVAAGGSAGGAVAAVGSGAAVGGGAAAISGAAGSGAVGSGLAAAGAGHMATILAATVVAAGGAIGIQHEVSQSAPPAKAVHAAATPVAAADIPTAAPDITPSSGATTSASATTTRSDSGSAAADATRVQGVAPASTTTLRRVTSTRSSHTSPGEATFHAPPTGFPTGSTGTGATSGATTTGTTGAGTTGTTGTTGTGTDAGGTGATGTTGTPTTGTTGTVTGTTSTAGSATTATTTTTTTPGTAGTSTDGSAGTSTDGSASTTSGTTSTGRPATTLVESSGTRSSSGGGGLSIPRYSRESGGGAVRSGAARITGRISARR